MHNTSKPRLLNIAFLQISIMVLSLAGIFAKKASLVTFFSVEFFIYYFFILIIMAIYAILWQQVIKKFELSVAYANKGTIIIWTFIWAVVFFQETITVNNIIGALLVIIGIVLVFKDVK